MITRTTPPPLPISRAEPEDMPTPLMWAILRLAGENQEALDAIHRNVLVFHRFSVQSPRQMWRPAQLLRVSTVPNPRGGSPGKVDEVLANVAFGVMSHNYFIKNLPDEYQNLVFTLKPKS
jgi:hypothetical protein